MQGIVAMSELVSDNALRGRLRCTSYPQSSDGFGLIEVGNTPCGEAFADSPRSGWSQQEQRRLYLNEGNRARHGANIYRVWGCSPIRRHVLFKLGHPPGCAALEYDSHLGLAQRRL